VLLNPKKEKKAAGFYKGGKENENSMLHNIYKDSTKCVEGGKNCASDILVVHLSVNQSRQKE